MTIPSPGELHTMQVERLLVLEVDALTSSRLSSLEYNKRGSNAIGGFESSERLWERGAFLPMFGAQSRVQD